MECPKCQAAMQTVAVEGVEIDRCSGCAGIWFDLREHEHLMEKADAGDVDPGAVAGEALPGAGVGDLDAVRDIDCPRCHTKLVKMTVREQPHLRYEQCSVCGGVYLDAGEFADMKTVTVGERLRAMFRRR